MVSLLRTLLILEAAYLVLGGGSGTESDPCTPTFGTTFVFKFDPFAAATGYYTVDGCGGGTLTQPVLLMQAGVEYTFDQTDISNWRHPLGFAYYPDGALKGQDELELEIDPPGTGSTDGCAATSSCQSPLYYGGINGTTYLGGTTSLLSAANNPFAGQGDGGFGLDTYEPQFGSWSREFWRRNKYNVKLTITDSLTATLFYFCHIHEWMSGRILVSDTALVSGVRTTNGAGIVPLYAKDVQSPADTQCGTTNSPNYGDTQGPGVFTPDSSFCQGRTYLCDVGMDTFGMCMQRIDCQMHHEMKVFNNNTDSLITFMHQMIPHHQNAVNMAKIALMLVPNMNQEIQDLMWEILNGQNAQIVQMSKYLEENQYQQDDQCFVNQECKDESEGKCDPSSSTFISFLTVVLVLGASIIGTVIYVCCVVRNEKMFAQKHGSLDHKSMGIKAPNSV